MFSARSHLQRQWYGMQSLSCRMFARHTRVQNTNQVRLRGKFLASTQGDNPTMIWLPDIVERAENFEPFFSREDNKIRSVRNVWLLNYRNQGGSDHHDSYDMDDLSNDIVRFMDENKITMATIGGHGFGAKVAAATAINHMNRFTGVIQYEGGPLTHTHYEAWQELAGYIKFANELPIAEMELGVAHRAIDDNVLDRKWASIFKQNLVNEGSGLSWVINLKAMTADVNKYRPNLSGWSKSYGLWPGQTLALFAAHSRWVHLSTNTLPFYNVFPKLQGQFPRQINTHADGFESPDNHWLHEHEEGHPWQLSQRMYRWLRWNDGANVLLADKSEAGWYWVPERGYDSAVGAKAGEMIPEHVHHDYLHTDEYVKSRELRGKQGAGHGTFLPVDQWSPEDRI